MRVRCSLTRTARPPRSGSQPHDQGDHALPRILRVGPRRLVSARQTCGRRGAYGPMYTSSTSSMRQTNAASAAGGMHHCACSHGLSRFALRRGGPSRAPRSRRSPSAPARRPAAAQARLVLVVELARVHAIGPLARQGRLQPGRDAFAPDAADRGRVHFQGPGDRGIGPARRLRLGWPSAGSERGAAGGQDLSRD